jgi:hypothetical protein
MHGATIKKYIIGVFRKELRIFHEFNQTII